MDSDSGAGPHPVDTGWHPGLADRRQILGGMFALGLLVGTPLAIWSQTREQPGAGASASQRHLLERLADLVIPATDTPGALAVGVPAFVELALLHGLDGTAPETMARVQMQPDRGGLPILDLVAGELDRRSQGTFTSLSPARQTAVLTAYDAAAYAQDQGDHPWRKIKALILTGYYTSEVGASRELQYELVPGRFDPDLPLPANNRSWSSDWTAVDFG
ncbi:gluconate 2-dehydrogenase subunit 3 family protein [Sphingobium sp. HBC34]|uniref:Gluconate 2-dehydrogenase subunit 3 family protein n=1 Tax=Sphingobium cyanobacteriorum TaxID=3063954 RepID=A0ABT8ZGR6_9SPHN|nr:gluconate 2-dehydrogenase subunit 3 family protein [Sphingobium sp. HBC34]MDO7833728.1 gluconate 2-dehydrogenase subunit 3 family protein [Sphingobium sp. HBC34]